MAVQGVHRAEVEAVIAQPDEVETSVEWAAYHGSVGGRRLRVVVVNDSEPLEIMAVVVLEA